MGAVGLHMSVECQHNFWCEFKCEWVETVVINTSECAIEGAGKDTAVRLSEDRLRIQVRSLLQVQLLLLI